MKNRMSDLGFTLFELVIVVAILGILSSIAIPQIIDTVALYGLRAETRELMINFKKAKVEAVKNNRNAVIAFTAGVGAEGGSYQVFIDRNSNGTYQNGVDQQLILQQMRRNLLLSGVTFTANRTWFTPRGMVPLAKTGQCEIRRSDGRKRSRLVLSTTGATRIEVSADGITWSAQ